MASKAKKKGSAKFHKCMSACLRGTCRPKRKKVRFSKAQRRAQADFGKASAKCQKKHDPFTKAFGKCVRAKLK